MTAEPPIDPRAKASRSAWRAVASAAAPRAAADNLVFNLGAAGWPDLVSLCRDRSGRFAAIGYGALGLWVEEFASDAECDEAAAMILQGQLDRRPKVRLACIEASFNLPVLVRLMFSGRDRAGSPVRASLIDDEDGRVRAAALRRMSDVRPGSRVARGIISATAGSHRKIREAAIAALADEPIDFPPLRFSHDLDLLHAVASGKGRYSPQARGDAAAALAIRRDRRSIKLIANQLRDPYVDPAWVRAAELAASTRFVAPLRRLAELGWAEEPLRGTAQFRRRALGEARRAAGERETHTRRKRDGGQTDESSPSAPDHQHQPAALPHPLAGTWNPLDRRQRRALVRAGRDGGLLRAWLGDPDPLLRAAGLCAIEWSDEPLATGAATRAARHGLAEEPACLVRVAVACTSVAGDRGSDTAALLNDRCPLVRVAALDTAAGRQGGEINPSSLAKALTDSVVEVRALAATVIAQHAEDSRLAEVGGAVLAQLAIEPARSVRGILTLAAILLDLAPPEARVADELRSPYAPYSIVRAAELQPRSEYSPLLSRLSKFDWARHMPEGSRSVLRRARSQALRAT